MSNNIVANYIWLVGAGSMAIDYSKVLQNQSVRFDVIGRGEASAQRFVKQTGTSVITGGLAKYLKHSVDKPSAAIVAVGVEELAETTIQLMNHGIKRILVEKPAGLNLEQIEKVVRVAEVKNAEVFVAYNRRFYASVQKAQELITIDGGVSSFNFEFTEWGHIIQELNKPDEVKAMCFLTNSTHVVDMAFYLGGEPRESVSYTAGSLEWHPLAAVFVGAGRTENGALFSYQANWNAPGRWGVEILTKYRRFIFRPLEQLQVQNKGSIKIEQVEIDDVLDKAFKPGLYKQVETFLYNCNSSKDLLSLKRHRDMVKNVYMSIMDPGRK